MEEEHPHAVLRKLVSSTESHQGSLLCFVQPLTKFTDSHPMACETKVLLIWRLWKQRQRACAQVSFHEGFDSEFLFNQIYQLLHVTLLQGLSACVLLSAHLRRSGSSASNPVTGCTTTKSVLFAKSDENTSGNVSFRRISSSSSRRILVHDPPGATSASLPFSVRWDWVHSCMGASNNSLQNLWVLQP